MLTAPAVADLHRQRNGMWGHPSAGLDWEGQQTVPVKICNIRLLMLQSMLCSSGAQRLMITQCEV